MPAHAPQHGIVVADLARLLDAQDLIEVEIADRDKGRAGLFLAPPQSARRRFESCCTYKTANPDRGVIAFSQTPLWPAQNSEHARSTNLCLGGARAAIPHLN